MDDKNMNNLSRIVHLIKGHVSDSDFVVDATVEWYGSSCDGDFINMIYRQHHDLPAEGIRLHVPRFAQLFSENSDEDLAYEIAFNIREPHEVSGERNLPWGEGIVPNPEQVVWTIGP
ncbi:MAG: hypothetical protein ACTHZ5_04440 [Micrococcaceae bacterium]